MTIADSIEDTEWFDKFVNVSKQFYDVVQQENTCLESFKLKDALTLLPQKQTLAEQHQQMITSCSKEPNLIQKLPINKQTILKDTLHNLHGALKKNREALSFAHQVQSDLVGQITQIIREHEVPTNQYSRNKRPQQRTTPLSIDIVNKSI